MSLNSSSYNYYASFIIVLWRHKISFHGIKKPKGIRLIVIGPSNLLINEHNVDIIYNVDGPITSKDYNFVSLLQKVKEQCSALENTKRIIYTFERCLQRQIAQIREELGIEGLTVDKFDQLMHKQSVRAICKRNGLQTLKFCSFGLIQGKPDEWISHANNQIGNYPMLLRPVNVEQNCLHTLSIVKNNGELKNWIKARPHSSNFASETDYLIEECLIDGFEFISIASLNIGLIGTFCSIDSHKPLICSVLSQQSYAIEYLNSEMTRDILPGVESFVMQTLKTVFIRSDICSSLVFIKGFYKGHNAITFLSGSYELGKKSLTNLFTWANGGITWESISIQFILNNLNNNNEKEKEEKVKKKKILINDLNNNEIYKNLLLENGLNENKNNYFALINFPNNEGVLLHQSSILLKAYSTSKIRLAWRVSEGEELLDADGIDDNILQIFLTNTNRFELLRDVADLCRRIEIPIDRNSISGTERRLPICRRDLRAIAASSSSPFNSRHQLIRSCTTTD
ncbi:hypothetical protein Mgra_00002227 [Meloidogyne graminicola]|uniref:ATP-grasp domain-containing protein n=1 Tax=Meloidogyne graminicola TaxID=189291 RepID=A0A8S9ZZD8_9BILA|nr:hypothetical protein Mgra_00002227 [Meloidogyne graminicola]